MARFIVCIFNIIFSRIKSRRIRWTGNLTSIEVGRSAFKILTREPTEDTFRMA